ncbi:MAG: LON peptidase substrate-binding domain-containing protein [Acidimicrobiia bacterium]
MELPMVPLGTALVPFQLLPLQVFEPRYQVMIRRCLDADRRFGVVLIERGAEVGGGDIRFDVGTVARILEWTELPDGRLGLAARGEERLRVLRWLPDDPFPRAEVELVADPPPTESLRAHRVPLAAAFARVVELARVLGADVPPGLALDADPLRAGWEATAMAPIGPIDVLAILREDDPDARLARITAALDDAAELLELRRHTA